VSKKEYIASVRVKPLGIDGLEAIKRIKVEGYAKVNEVLVDAFSASAIEAVYAGLNEANRAKLLSFPVAKVCEICFKLINKGAK
jgi:hypothetical protein